MPAAPPAREPAKSAQQNKSKQPVHQHESQVDPSGVIARIVAASSTALANQSVRKRCAASPQRPPRRASFSSGRSHPAPAPIRDHVRMRRLRRAARPAAGATSARKRRWRQAERHACRARRCGRGPAPGSRRRRRSWTAGARSISVVRSRAMLFELGLDRLLGARIERRGGLVEDQDRAGSSAACARSRRAASRRPTASGRARRPCVCVALRQATR